MKVKKRDIVVFALALAFWVATGCHAYLHQAAQNSAPEAMQTNGRATAHNEDQGTVLKEAKPHSDPTGKSLIDVAIQIGDKTASALKDNAVQVMNLNQQIAARDKVLGDKDREILADQARYKVLYNSWGCRLQRFVEFWFRVLLLWVVVAFACRILGGILPPPYATVLAIIGTVLWPFTWIHSLCDNAHFRGWFSALRGVVGGVWSKVF